MASVSGGTLGLGVGVGIGVGIGVGSGQVRRKAGAAAKSYYAWSEGQVQVPMLPHLGISNDGQDLAAADRAAECDSAGIGGVSWRYLLPPAREEVVRSAECAAADAEGPALSDASGDAEPVAADVMIDEIAVDTGASRNDDEAQLAETAPFVEEIAANAEAFPMEETFEFVEIAPVAVEETTAEVSAEPAQNAAENVEETRVPVVAEVEPEISDAAHWDFEFAEIAAPAVEDESGDQFSASPMPAIVETVDFVSLPANDAGRAPLTPAFGFLNFYGLSEQPFDVTPDPAYLYLSSMHRDALTSLSKGIENLRGFMALVAEPGMGKTTLLNRLMEDLHETARTVLLFQTQCNSRELLRYLLSELGIESEGMDVVSMHRALNEILFQEMLNGRRFVLIIDEAQNLDATTLETIRLLSDFETTHAKLIQIVLAGQPQLIETLLRPELSQLRQRIAILTNLEPLGASETAQYIEHRLRAAGSSGRAIFTAEALELIAERSHGIPRSINNLCFNALQLGYSKECERIDAEIVGSAAGNLDLEALLPARAQEPVSAPQAIMALESPSSQLARVLLDALTGAQQAAQQSAKEPAARTAIVLTGKLSEKLKTRSWGNECEYRIQVSLAREASPEIPVADRYYCCSIYVGEEEAKRLQAGQPVRIRIEQD